MKKIYTFFIVITLLFTYSCSRTLDCLIPREPELPNVQLPIGSTETYYFVEFNTEINNEPRDNDYDYYFEVEGLPPGMDYFVNYRTLSLEGTPQNPGTYDVRVYLFVDGPFRNNFDNDPDILCNYNTSKTYTLIVE